MRGTKETNLSLHHAHSDIHYVCKYINFCHFFFQKYFNSKYNLTTYFNRKLSNNSIWTSTDIPNTCRDIIVLYVSDTWISNTWIFNILFCTWRPGPALQDCVILIVIEVDMNNYTILQLINNHFAEIFFYIWNKQLINYWIDDKFSLL